MLLVDYIQRYVAYLDYPAYVWWMVLLYLCLPIIVYIVMPFLYGNISTQRRVVVFVLGDLGHSPRICYHARSFAKKGWAVDLCGYLEENPPMDLIDDENIDIHEVPITKNTYGLPFILFAFIKVFLQIKSIVSILWRVRGANYILIQNPPSIPILLLAVIFKYLTGAKLIIDWHNLGYSILLLKFGKTNHPLVMISKMYEGVLSRFANINLTVTKAMKQYLIDDFKVKSDTIIVLYDKAADQFKPVSSQERSKIIESHKEIFGDFDIKNDKLLMSSTSFTPDENFNVLLKAFELYDTTPDVPRLKVLITGKGPLKKEFLENVKVANFKNINIQSIWLTAEEYPRVLATADLGISLHTSSSGIDLPMKVVDMFGCGIPVIALDFPALPELVKDQKNGKRVVDYKDLYEALKLTFRDDSFYDKIKNGAMLKSEERWDSNWKLKFGDTLVN